MMAAVAGCAVAWWAPSMNWRELGRMPSSSLSDPSLRTLVASELRIRDLLGPLSVRYGKYLADSRDLRRAMEAWPDKATWHRAEDVLQMLQELEPALKDAARKVGDAQAWDHEDKDSILRASMNGQEFDEQSSFPVDARREVEITALARFPLIGGRPRRELLIPNSRFHISVALENRLERPLNPSHAVAKKAAEITARFECSAPVRIKKALAFDQKDAVRGEFIIANGATGHGRPEIVFGSEPVRCDVYFKRAQDKDFVAGLRIISDDSLEDQRLAGQVREICYHDPEEGKNPAAGGAVGLMARMAYDNVTCVHRATEARLLSVPYEGISEKFRALSGSLLTPQQIEKKDPEMVLDFTRAPKLDFVALSALEFKNDFYGHLMARALRFHAERGAKVKIMVPATPFMVQAKDKVLLEALKSYSPNVEILYYEFNGKNLHRFHRTVHAKILVALSRSQPEANLVITGGRNVKDTFVFRERPDYRHHPSMIQYGKDEPFIFMADLEILVRSREIALQVASQLVSMMYQDTEMWRYRPTTLHVPTRLSAGFKAEIERRLRGETFVRHLISAPYVDNRQMEQLFVDLFTSAKRSVKIVSPYFRPTPKIADALTAAVDRGVVIEFVTGVSLKGDNSPAVTEDVTQDSVNRFRDKLKIYAWNGRGSMLHSKAVLVDEEVLYIGGTNLNNRSFNHDIECGFVLSGPEIGKQFSKLFREFYVAQSYEITEAQRISLLARIVIPILGGFF